jgi:SAM-dependent methyltransferase/ribosomal protein S18 acetylase RimI-like enzyme
MTDAPAATVGNFSQERDCYAILRWPLSAFRRSGRSLPDGYRIVRPPVPASLRSQEKQLLQQNFPSWQTPYQGQLAGFRPDSPIYICSGEQLVGGLYVCADHEFERNRHWGQLHYFFVDPAYRGKGLHTILVEEAMEQARCWNLDGVYVNTDRYGLPEVYQRWGAELWKEIPKANGPLTHLDAQPWNWLVHRIHVQALWGALRRYASGVLVDIGCGKKPYAGMTRGMVTQHIGVDYSDSLHGLDGVDIIADAYNTTLGSAVADTVMCTTVLEHLERPQEAISEMFRILKPDGYVILSMPLFWHLHEEPRDFFRYTKYGIEHLLKTSGFEVVEIQPLSGFVVTFGQEFCYWLESLSLRLPHRVVHFVEYMVQRIALWVHGHGWDKAEAFTWLYLVVGHKAADIR